MVVLLDLEVKGRELIDTSDLGLEQVRSNHVEVFTENRGFGGGIKVSIIWRFKKNVISLTGRKNAET